MTTPAARQAPSALRTSRSLPVHLAWTAPVAFVGAALLWNASAYALDDSEQTEAFGYSFATVILSVLVGLPVLLLVTLPGLVAFVRGSAPAGGLRLAAWASGLTALGVGFLGVVALLGGAGDADVDEVVFGLFTLTSAALLVVPVYVLSRTLAAPEAQ